MISIASEKKRIGELLHGLEVVVKGKQKRGAFEERGKIKGIEPWVFLELEYDRISSGIRPFVGIDSGIYEIINAGTGKVIYRNPVVEEIYQNREFVNNFLKVSILNSIGESLHGVNAVPFSVIEARERGEFYLENM